MSCSTSNESNTEASASQVRGLMREAAVLRSKLQGHVSDGVSFESLARPQVSEVPSSTTVYRCH
jgi:hypothetical protein